MGWCRPLHRLTWARERLDFSVFPLPAILLLPVCFPMERHLEVPECWQYSKLVFWFALVEGLSMFLVTNGTMLLG